MDSTEQWVRSSRLLLPTAEPTFRGCAAESQAVNSCEQSVWSDRRRCADRGLGWTQHVSSANVRFEIRRIVAGTH
jgi:hypothetical protein